VEIAEQFLRPTVKLSHDNAETAAAPAEENVLGDA